MRAELVVDATMGAFAQQIQIEIAQDRRKAVRIVELDHGLAEAGAQLIALRAVRQQAYEQAGVVDARQRGRFAVFVDRVDLRGLRQECADHGFAALRVQSEIVKGIGVAAFHDRVSLGG